MFTGKRLVVLTLVVQCLLCIVGFNKIIFGGDSYLFNNRYDAIKNYYTYNAYVLQPSDAGYSMLNTMNYPYGESIFYVDNTPLLAVVVRWLHLNVIDLTDLAIPIFHYYMISGLLFSSLLLILTFRQWQITGFITFFSAITLPWLCSQIWRLIYGHFNLSFSWILLAAILVSMLLVKYVYARKLSIKYLGVLALALLLMLFAAFNHLYYIPIVGMILAGIPAVASLTKLRKWKRGAVMLFSIGGVLAVSILSVLQLIKYVDPYMDERDKVLGGFNIQAWNLKLSYLYSAYSNYTINFIVSDEVSYDLYESFAFLGNGALYALLFFVVIVIARYFTGLPVKPIFNDRKGAGVLGAIVIVGFIGVLIALGEMVQLSGTWYKNLLNPLIYIQEIVPQVTQFRALARFAWVSFWSVNLAVVWLMVRSKKHYASVMLVAWVLFTCVDLADSISAFNGTYMTNYFSKEQKTERRTEVADIPLAEYDALLPVPFFYVGANTKGYIDEVGPPDAWESKVLAASLAWDLPMMASKAGRTSEKQAWLMAAMFRGEPLPDELRHKLNGKKILVYVKNDHREICACEAVFKDGPAANVICNLPLVAEGSDGGLFVWRP